MPYHVRHISLVIFFIIIFGFIFFVRPVTTANEIKIFSSSLENFIVPNIYLDTVEYSVDQGNVARIDGNALSPSQRVRVLKVAYGSVITRTAPLFSFAGADPKNLRASAQILEKSLKSLQKFYTLEEQDILNAGFYPIELARSIARTEEARGTLVEKPSELALRTYINNTQKSLNTLNVYASAVQNMYERVLPNDSQWRYNFVGGRTTRANVLVFTNQIQDEIQKLTREFEERIRCIQNISSACKKLSLTFQFEKNLNANVRAHQIPRDIELNRKNLTDAYNILPSFINESATELPFLIENPYCFPDKNFAFYSLLKETYEGESLTKTLTFTVD